MSTTYSGKSIAIVSSTAAAPIAIVATAHGYSTGDVVQIAGHLLNLPANGSFTISVTGANGFTLNGSNGVGQTAGGATGTVTAYVASLTIPADGDARSAASVNVGTEALADRLAYMKAFTDAPLSATGRYPLGSRSLQRIAESTGNADPANWIHQVVGSLDTMKNLVQGADLYIPIRVPHGATLTGVTCYVLPAAGHGALPAVMPQFIVKKTRATTNVTSNVGAVVSDPSANVANYELFHGWSTAALTEIIDRTFYRYWVLFLAEGGANYVANLQFCHCLFTFTTPAQDDGAS